MTTQKYMKKFPDCEMLSEKHRDMLANEIKSGTKIREKITASLRRYYKTHCHANKGKKHCTWKKKNGWT